MTAFLAFLTTLAARLRRDPGTCRCGHPESTHRHHRPGRDCGACGDNRCPRYRAADLAAVCADPRLVDAVLDGDLDHALRIAEPEFVGLLAALAGTGRRA